MINWYFIVPFFRRQMGVLPQWKPMKVSSCR